GWEKVLKAASKHFLSRLKVIVHETQIDQQSKKEDTSAMAATVMSCPREDAEINLV
ncbi:hypothetical protein Tco_1574485, partial [Tanacetum coccineum]